MKMKNKLKFILFLMGMIMLTACRKNEDEGKAQPGPPSPPPPPARIIPIPKIPNGKWVTKCLPSETLKDYYYVKTLRFKDNKLETDIDYFEPTTATPKTNKCAQQSKAFNADFQTETVLGKVIDPWAEDQHTDIDITAKKVELTPTSGKYVINFNTPGWSIGIYSGFGETNWSIDTKKDVSSIPAAKQSFNIGKPLPDIFQVSLDPKNHKILKMGDKKGNLDPDGRPMSLDDKVIARYRG